MIDHVVRDFLPWLVWVIAPILITTVLVLSFAHLSRERRFRAKNLTYRSSTIWAFKAVNWAVAEMRAGERNIAAQHRAAALKRAREMDAIAAKDTVQLEVIKPRTRRKKDTA